MNWNAITRGLALFFAGQTCLLLGAVLVTIQPVVGMVVALIGVVFHTKLLIDILVGRGDDKGGRPA